LSFDASHPSITALIRHFVENAGKEGFSLVPLLKDREATNTAFFASIALLVCCIAANDALRRTIRVDELEGLVAEYNEIVTRTLPA
jgi:hypothetical protein